MKGLTREEKIIAHQYAINGADFMFEPTPELCNLIVKGSPEAMGINHVLTSIILQRRPIRLDSDMVLKYCEGTLDKNNTWLFDNGNIKVVPPRYKKPVKLKPKEELVKKKNNNTKIEENQDG